MCYIQYPEGGAVALHCSGSRSAVLQYCGTLQQNWKWDCSTKIQGCCVAAYVLVDPICCKRLGNRDLL